MLTFVGAGGGAEVVVVDEVLEVLVEVVVGGAVVLDVEDVDEVVVGEGEVVGGWSPHVPKAA